MVQMKGEFLELNENRKEMGWELGSILSLWKCKRLATFYNKHLVMEMFKCFSFLKVTTIIYSEFFSYLCKSVIANYSYFL